MNAASKLEAMIQSSKMKIENLSSELANEAADLASRMNKLVLRLEEGSSINALGEVQRRGAEVDRLCALLDAEQKNLVMLNWMSEDSEVAR